jgi:dienelactone hydrolase
MKLANIPAAFIATLASLLAGSAVCAVEATDLSTGGSGHYPAVMVSDPTLPTHTIYRPADLKGLGTEQLPIVAWGNGGCSNIGDSAKNFLLEVASHGFLVIAVGPPGKTQAAVGASTAEPRERGPRAQTRSAQLLDALDWAVAQNGRAGSEYFGHLNTKQTAVMGHSCGGLQALEVSPDPRVSASVILDSGILIDPPPFPMPGVVTNDKSELARLHAPLIYIIGGPTDIAYSNAADDFKRIDRIAVFMANTNVGHKGTFAEPNGGIFAQVTSAWLQWRLKHDQAAAIMFVGPQCGLCTDSAWSVQKKRIDQP